MAIKSLLCHVPDQAERARALRCAVELADDFGATILGLGAAAPPPFALRSGGAYGAIDHEWLSLLRDQYNAKLEAARGVFEAETGARQKVWRSIVAEPNLALAAAARGADLIIAPCPGAGGVDVYADVDVAPLVIKAGRPVLLCPSEADYLGDGPAMVAWKDTREARRAVIDALPLLRRSGDVLLVECTDEADTAPALARLQDLATALARHEVSARTEVIEVSGRTGKSLLTRAGQLGAQLIVAGGYGHTRLGEWAFGGVTRSLLEQDRCFVLLSH